MSASRLGSRRMLQHRKYCTPEQRAGGVNVKELHIQRENSMKYLPTRKKCVRGPTRPEIEIRKSSFPNWWYSVWLIITQKWSKKFFKNFLVLQTFLTYEKKISTILGLLIAMRFALRPDRYSLWHLHITLLLTTNSLKHSLKHSHIHKLTHSLKDSLYHFVMDLLMHSLLMTLLYKVKG